MPEYAAAMQLYKDTIARTVDPTHKHKDFAEVARALRAVPTRNKREHRAAQQLATMIEQAQAEQAAFLERLGAPLPPAAVRPAPSEPLPPSPPPPPTTTVPTTRAPQNPAKVMEECAARANAENAACIKRCAPQCTLKPDGGYSCPLEKPEDAQRLQACAESCAQVQVHCPM